MRAWIDDRGLTVVSGAGCSPAEAVTRRSGLHASEIDYVVVDAGRGVDVVSCATDGDDDGPLPDFVHIPLFLSGVLLFCIDAAAGRGSSTSTLPFVPFPPVDHGRPLRRCPRPPFVVLGVESAWSSRSSCLPGAGALVLNLPRSTASSLSVV